MLTDAAAKKELEKLIKRYHAPRNRAFRENRKKRVAAMQALLTHFRQLCDDYGLDFYDICGKSYQDYLEQKRKSDNGK